MVYMCKVWDGALGDWVDIGVFSTRAKAMEGGSLYIVGACGDVTLLDWEYDTNVFTDWYQDTNGRVFTRVVTECEVDKGLA
jgi:NifU-like protein involved in Fe-S cluster formation